MLTEEAINSRKIKSYFNHVGSACSAVQCVQLLRNEMWFDSVHPNQFEVRLHKKHLV